MMTAQRAEMTRALLSSVVRSSAACATNRRPKVRAPPEGFEDADPEDRFLDHRGQVADLVLGAAGEHLVPQLVLEAEQDQWDGEGGDDRGPA